LGHCKLFGKCDGAVKLRPISLEPVQVHPRKFDGGHLPCSYQGCKLGDRGECELFRRLARSRQRLSESQASRSRAQLLAWERWTERERRFSVERHLELPQRGVGS